MRTDGGHPDDLYDLPGVPESVLARSVDLPSTSPEAPWRTQVEATLWWHRSAKGAAGVLPAALDGRRSLPVTVAAFVRYLDSPVGTYSEVFASPVLVLSRVPRLHLPFIAVDSIPSVRGGRERWGLPKTVATFDGLSATGDGWAVRVKAVVRGPELPLWAPLPSIHVMPGGAVARSWTRITGRVRLTRVEVETEGPTLPHWMLPGRHWGVTGRATLVVGRPS
jgi:hypothetical protein